MEIVIFITIAAHIPAIIMIIVGISMLKSNPVTGKTLLALAGAYLIIGLGICGKLLTLW